MSTVKFFVADYETATGNLSLPGFSLSQEFLATLDLKNSVWFSLGVDQTAISYKFRDGVLRAHRGCSGSVAFRQFDTAEEAQAFDKKLNRKWRTYLNDECYIE